MHPLAADRTLVHGRDSGRAAGRLRPDAALPALPPRRHRARRRWPCCGSATASSTTTTACTATSASSSRADAGLPPPRHLGDHQRLRLRLARRRRVLPPNAVGSLFVRRHNNVVFNKLRPAVRRGDRHGLQPVPDPPAAGAGVRGVRQEQRGQGPQERRQAGYFMSWAYQDKPEMTAQLAEAYPGDANATMRFVSRPGSPSPVRSRAAGPEPVRRRQAPPEPGRHLPRRLLTGWPSVTAAVAGGQRLHRPACRPTWRRTCRRSPGRWCASSTLGRRRCRAPRYGVSSQCSRCIRRCSTGATISPATTMKISPA